MLFITSNYQRDSQAYQGQQADEYTDLQQVSDPRVSIENLRIETLHN